MTDVLIFYFRKHNGPTPADDMGPRIITDCPNFSLDFSQMFLTLFCFQEWMNTNSVTVVNLILNMFMCGGTPAAVYTLLISPILLKECCFAIVQWLQFFFLFVHFCFHISFSLTSNCCAWMQHSSSQFLLQWCCLGYDACSWVTVYWTTLKSVVLS